MTEAGVLAGKDFGLSPSANDSEGAPDVAVAEGASVQVTEQVAADGEDSDTGLTMTNLNLDGSDRDSDTKSMPPPEVTPPPVRGKDGKLIIPMSYLEWTLCLDALSEGRVRTDGRIKCTDGAVLWIDPSYLRLNRLNQSRFMLSCDREQFKSLLTEADLRAVQDLWWEDWVSLIIGITDCTILRDAVYKAGYLTVFPGKDVDSVTCASILAQADGGLPKPDEGVEKFSESLNVTLETPQGAGSSVASGGATPEDHSLDPDVSLATPLDSALPVGEEDMDVTPAIQKPAHVETKNGELMDNPQFAAKVKANLGEQSLDEVTLEEERRENQEKLKRMEEAQEATLHQARLLEQERKDLSAEKRKRDKDIKKLRGAVEAAENPTSSESGNESDGRRGRSRRRGARKSDPKSKDEAGWETKQYKKDKKKRTDDAKLQRLADGLRDSTPVPKPSPKLSKTKVPVASPKTPVVVTVAVKDTPSPTPGDLNRDGATAGRPDYPEEIDDGSRAGDGDETDFDEVPEDDSQDHTVAGTTVEQEIWDNARAKFGSRVPSCAGDCKRGLDCYSVPGRVDKNGESDDEEWIRATRKEVSANKHYTSLLNCYRLPCFPYYSYPQRNKLQYAHQEWRRDNQVCPFMGCKQDNVTDLTPKRYSTPARFARHLVERHMHHRPEYECVAGTPGVTKVNAGCTGYYSVRRGDMVRHLVAVHKKSFVDARLKVMEVHDKLWKNWAVYAANEELRKALKPSGAPFCVVDPIGTGKLTACFRAAPGHKFELEDASFAKSRQWRRKRAGPSPSDDGRKQQRLSEESSRGRALPIVQYGGTSYSRVAAIDSRQPSPLDRRPEIPDPNTWKQYGNRSESTGWENTTEAYFPNDRPSVPPLQQSVSSYAHPDAFPHLGPHGPESQTVHVHRDPSGRGRTLARGSGGNGRGGRGDVRSTVAVTPGGLQQKKGDKARPCATETSHSSLDDAPHPDPVGGFPGFKSMEAAATAQSRVVDPSTWVKIDNPGETEIGTRLFEKFSKGLEHHTMEFARGTSRMAYSLFQEAHAAERDALEARGDAQLMAAVMGASQAAADSETMKLFYDDEINKLRRVNDTNTVKFLSATGVTMDKWDGGVETLRGLLTKHEKETATRMQDAPVYSRRPVQSPTQVTKPKPAHIDLTRKPAAPPKEKSVPTKKEAEGAEEEAMETVV